MTDPAPDLCVDCASRGLWSEMWGPDRVEEYKTFVRRLTLEGEHQ